MKTSRICFFVFALFCSQMLARGQDYFLDTSFNPGTGVNGFAECVLVQPDGKVLISGNFTSYNGVARGFMVRLNADGSLDSNFVSRPNYWVRTMALQPDGKIVIGGFFTDVGGLPRSRVARVNADGTVDPTFNPGAGCEGRIVPADPTDPFVFAVKLQDDGKILIGGNFTNYNKFARCGVARLNADGSLDTTFNVGSGVDSWVRSILVLPNQQILFSGWFQNYNSRGHDRMVRVNPDGSADESFKTHIGFSTAIYSMAAQSDGKVIVGGHSVNTNSPFSQEVVRLNLDGSYDLTFNPGGEGADDKVEMVLLQPDGKILIGGYFSLYNGTRAKSIARLNSDGTLDTNFVSSANNWVWSIALQEDKKFLIAGAFSSVNGVSRNGIARLNPTNDPPPPPPEEPEPETDLIPPTIGITAPTESSRRVSDYRIVGTASDNVSVAQVLYRVGTGEFIPADGTTNWTADATLQAGENTIEVKSVDAAGNESPIVRRKFIYVPSARLPLEVTGPGSTTLTNGQLLQIGKRHTIKAEPIGSNLFVGWTGSVTSSQPTLRFVMSSNFFLRANFATNFFAPVLGNYNGLFSSTNGVVPSTTGFLSINLKDRGVFSGMILLEGARSSFSGRFSPEGFTQATIRRPARTALDVQLQLDFAGGLSGTVSQNGEISFLTAERSQLPPSLANTKYTFLISPGEDSAVSPGGYGYGSALVDSKGKIRFRGALGDGTIIQQSAAVSTNGRWPLFVSLYRGKGVLSGWITFTNEPGSDLRGEAISWTKNSGASGKFYPSGFSLTVPLEGSLYNPPAGSGSPVNWTTGSIAFTGGNLTTDSTNAIMVDNRRFVIQSGSKTAININPSSGLLNGSFVHPATGKRTALKGALLQKQQLGAGTFFGSTESGSFVTEAAP